MNEQKFMPIFETPEKEIENSKEYELKLNKDIYLLNMSKDSDIIHFNVKQINELSYYNYENEYKYDELIKKLLLQKEDYDNINTIFYFLDVSFSKGNAFLTNNNKNKKQNLILVIKDNNDKEYLFELKQVKIKNEDAIKILFNEINEIKHEKKEIELIKKENEDLKSEIKELKKEKEEMQNGMKLLIEEMSNNIKLLFEENKMEKKSNELKKESTVKDDLKIGQKKEPNFKFFSYLINDVNSYLYSINNFEVYTSLADNTEYLAYTIKNNHVVIEIMKILDDKNARSLIGHNDKIVMIKYFDNNNKEEYLMSCDITNLLIIWDIQNDYDNKYWINVDGNSNIYDALLLFNIYNENYILISKYSKEYTKLYEFKNNMSFIKDIYGTNENKTFYMIPWEYNKQYYIIECCENIISIYNVLDDENYYKIKKYGSSDNNRLGACLTNNKYLYVSNLFHNQIIIYDLIKKEKYKSIDINLKCNEELLSWNTYYIIISYREGLAVFDLIENRIIQKVEIKRNFLGLKKIKLSKYGESLICSSFDSSIKLFTQ